MSEFEEGLSTSDQAAAQDPEGLLFTGDAVRELARNQL
jgi:hypothetical protein